MDSASVEIGDLKSLLLDQEQLNEELDRQRKQALSDVASASPLIPWYVWTLIGFGAGVVVTSRIR